MRSYDHKLNGLHVRRILHAHRRHARRGWHIWRTVRIDGDDRRHARRVDGWSSWRKVAELSALAGALLVLVLLLELMR